MRRRIKSQKVAKRGDREQSRGEGGRGQRSRRERIPSKLCSKRTLDIKERLMS